MTEVLNPPLPGKVPEHWKALRLKHWIGINESVLPESTDPGFEFRYMEISAVDHGRLIEFPQKTHFEVAPSRARRRVKLGDTLLSTVRTYLKAIWYAENPGDDLVCSTGFAVLTPKKGTNPKYVNYLVQSEPFTDKITAESVGTAYPAISENKLASFEVRVPPTDEQAAIVRYLDAADQRIRAYVSAKERLVALLAEERQAVIHQAVTRGLDPNVKLKPSGIEWLGDVPEHWEILRLDSLATKFGSGITPRGGASVYQETGIPFLRSQNIHFDGLRLTDVARISPSLHQELASSHVKPGDVLLNITGASIGRVSTVPPDFEDANVNQHVCIIRPKQDLLLSKLLSAYLSTQMMQQEIQSAQSGASREGLTLQSIRDFNIIIPPIIEQQAMVKHFENVTAKIYAAMDRARRQIDLMEEYRTRLIADVVTGKIDVREAKPRPAAFNQPLEEERSHCYGPGTRTRTG